MLPNWLFGHIIQSQVVNFLKLLWTFWEMEAVAEGKRLTHPPALCSWVTSTSTRAGVVRTCNSPRVSKLHGIYSRCATTMNIIQFSHRNVSYNFGHKSRCKGTTIRRRAESQSNQTYSLPYPYHHHLKRGSTNTLKLIRSNEQDLSRQEKDAISLDDITLELAQAQPLLRQSMYRVCKMPHPHPQTRRKQD
jgi:hypothetical protein